MERQRKEIALVPKVIFSVPCSLSLFGAIRDLIENMDGMQINVMNRRWESRTHNSTTTRVRSACVEMHFLHADNSLTYMFVVSQDAKMDSE
jgi:hypothetical protein